MHVFLSPHFDDAVFSCGGMIHSLTQRGYEVHVLTIMAGSPEFIPDSPIVRDAHARWAAGKNPVKTRQEEDFRAVGALGANAVHSEWPDCIYRTLVGTSTPCYPTRDSLFGEVHPFDKAATLYSWFSSSNAESASTFYVPLGVGHHVDHQIVRNIGIIFKREKPSLALKFYEEYPYLRDKTATQQALDLFASVAPDLRLEMESIELTETDIQAKIEAIACYRSQIGSFWANVEAMEQEMRGITVERFWCATSS